MIHWGPSRRVWFSTVLLVLVGVGGCDPNEALGPNPDLEALVGDWRATQILLSDPEGQGAPVDALTLGVTFDLNIQASGLYTVIATASGVTLPEIGRLHVSDGEIIFAADFPSAGVSEATYDVTDDTLVLTGVTSLGLLAGQNSQSLLEMELTRQ